MIGVHQAPTRGLSDSVKMSVLYSFPCSQKRSVPLWIHDDGKGLRGVEKERFEEEGEYSKGVSYGGFRDEVWR